MVLLTDESQCGGRRNHEITETTPRTAGGEKGLTRVPLPGSWVGFRNFAPRYDCDRPREQRGPLELADEIITFSIGRVVEWNGSCFTASGLLEGLGVRVRLMEHRFSSAVESLKKRTHGSNLTKRPLMVLGTAQSSHEIRAFHTLLGAPSTTDSRFGNPVGSDSRDGHAVTDSTFLD